MTPRPPSRAPRRRGPSPPAIPLALALFATGCVTVVDFDPVGSAASIDVEWRVGSRPPTAESCAGAGIHQVRVGFYDGVGDVRRVDHGALIFACHFPGSRDPSVQGRYPQIQPDGSQPRVRLVRAGDWRLGLVAVDAAGAVVASGPIEAWSVADGDHVDPAPVDFFPAPAP